jgi:UDP-N-acetylmuramyl-tripeptide synthetase
MKLQRLVECVDGVGGVKRGDVSEETVVTDIVVDSREVSSGSLFVALEGAEADGHDYIEEAIESGACAVLAEAHRADEVRESLSPHQIDETEWLTAEDTRRWLGPLASAFFEHPSEALLVFGITGTNGKTTTSFILESLLKSVGVDAGLIGTVVNRWSGFSEPGPNTTPESLTLHRWMARMRDAGVEAVVLEVSSHALETGRLGGVDIDVGVLTNLSQDHLDFHGSMEAYRRAKARLFTEVLPWSRAGASGRKTLAGEPTAVLNLDDAFGRRLHDEVDEGTDVVTYGLESPGATWRATVRSQSLAGSRIDIQAGSRCATVEWPLLGRFNVSNALAAGAAAMAAGAGFRDIVRGLESVEPAPGRLQRVDAAVDSAPTVFVDYAHSPEAVEHVLQTLRPLTSGRLIGLLGCGGDRDVDKRPQMGRVLAEGTDVAVFTSDNPRSESPETIIDAMLRGARDADGPVDSDFPEDTGMWVEVDRGAAIDEAIERAGAEDVVLIAGKGHETYQEIAGRRRPFDDVDRARRALEAHHA